MKDKFKDGMWEFTSTMGARCLFIHYSADKDCNPETEQGAKWYQKKLAQYGGNPNSPEWRQEMEIDFSARLGERVIPSWDSKYVPKVVCNPPEIQHHWPIHAGFDYGLDNPTAFYAVAFASKRLAYVFDELVVRRTHIYDVVRAIRNKWYFGEIQSIIGDPSIWAKTQHGVRDITSVGRIMEELGVHVDKGRNDVGVDLAFVNMLLGDLWLDLDNPRLLISSNCTHLIRCFRDLRWKKRKSLIDESTEPDAIISKGVDPFDALKYVMMADVWEEPKVESFLPGTIGAHIEEIEKTMYPGERIYGR